MAFGKKINRFPCTEKLDNAYGICAHLGFTSPNEQAVRERHLKCMDDAAIGYFRTNILWNNLQEYSSQPISWTQWDAVMTSMKSHPKIKVLPIICGTLKEKDWRPVVNYLDKWKDFVSSLAYRYRNDIEAFEVENEINFSSDYPPAKNVELLQATYPAVKNVSPNTKVVLGAIGDLNWNKDYLEGLCKLKAYEYFDVMNFHAYCAWETPEALIVQEFTYIQDLMSKYNWNRPVWLTEIGHTAAPRQIEYEERSGKGFFTEVLPVICQTKLDMNLANTTVGLMSDPATLFTGAGRFDPEICFNRFGNYRYVTLNDLKTLNPEEVPVLIVSGDQDFPMKSFDDLENYVRMGGTAVFSVGVPFYRDFSPLDLKRNTLMPENTREQYCKRLHIKYIFPWTIPDCPSVMSWQQPAGGFNFDYRWEVQNLQIYTERFLYDTNLKAGDEFIPVLYEGGGDYTGTVIGLYKLNSDLKGNVIIQTREQTMLTSNSEKAQADRLPRAYLISFALGIDRVFWYAQATSDGPLTPENSEGYFGILSNGSINPRPAYYAFQTLTAMCPNESTRPVLTEKEGAYLATWTKPDGVKAAAVWTPMAPLKVKLNVLGNARYYEYIHGTEIQADPDNFTAKPGITYIVGADVSFLENIE
ncbi:MAG: glycoside hydrolase family protein, partial [Tannerella sp.]|jgi:hypothetical protein|nr:glycoside hydrolase family protein [Tannerella sp.]